VRNSFFAVGLALLPLVVQGRPLLRGAAAPAARRGDAAAGVVATKRAPLARGPAAGRSRAATIVDTRAFPRSDTRAKATRISWQPPEHEIPSRPGPYNHPSRSAPLHAYEV